MVSIISWNEAGALVNPNGITVYSKDPWYMWKAVFHSSPSAILMRLYPFLRSNLVNHFPPLVLSKSSLMSGKGYLLGMVRRLRAWESTQSLREPSFLRTNRIGAAVAERDRLTLPVGRFSVRLVRRASFSSHVVL